MNWKSVGMTVVATATLTLTACGNDTGQETGQGLNNGNGVQQTRFNTTTDYPNDGNVPYGTRNYQENRQGTDGYDGMFSNNLGNNNDITRNGANNRNVNNNGNLDNRNNFNTRNNNTDNNIDTTRNNNQDNNQYEVSDEAADRIADQVDDVDRAYVLTTDNNAYVAAELNRGTNGNGNGEDVSEELKSEIRRVVQDVDNDIENVYVSTNPDFVNLTNNYVDDVNNGEPIEGFFDQFGEMIQRIFPRAR